MEPAPPAAPEKGHRRCWPWRRRQAAVEDRTGLDRIVFVPSVPPAPPARQPVYPTNRVRTTKYTLWNFVPKNLFLQFMRVANSYFLLMFILQTIPLLNAWPVLTAWVPITFVLLATAVKDAIEDFKRYQSDRSLNNQNTDILVNGTFMPRMWKDIEVGNIVRIRDNEDVPADVLVLATSEPQGVCYVETKNLDGETNLKERRGLKRTEHCQSAEELAKLVLEVHAEAPSRDLYSFTAAVVVGEHRKQETVGADSLLLRGCRLRNCASAYGLVLYTGADTKIVLNGGGTPLKRTKLEKVMNRQIVVIIIIQLVVCIIFSIAYSAWLKTTSADNPPFSVSTFEPGLNLDYIAFLNFFTLMIITQNLIPIAMYASVEIVKLVQAFFIYLDEDMRDTKTGERCNPNTWTLSDDLGQIEYVFSDKTGTLTSNIMKFRQCTVGGKVYGRPPDMIGTASPSMQPGVASAPNGEDGIVLRDLKGAPSTRPTSPRSVGRASTTGADSAPARYPSAPASPRPRRDSIVANATRWNELRAQLRATLGEQTTSLASGDFEFDDEAIVQPLVDVKTFVLRDDPAAAAAAGPERVRHARAMHDFLMAIAVCHGVMTERVDESLANTAEGLKYSAQSPDEVALVQAARNFGYVFLGRSRNDLECLIGGERMPIKVLYSIPFSSERKRMSTIVKLSDGSVRLFCKGADNIILERSASGQDELAAQLEQHLEDFSRNGLRTLCYAYRDVDGEQLGGWVQQVEDAHMLPPQERDAKLTELYAIMECDLLLLGGTAIEDKLQNGVPEAVAALRAAGIHVWMLTGDKLETAINIGLSCRLFDDGDMRIVLQGHSDDSVTLELLSQYYKLFPDKVTSDVVGVPAPAIPPRVQRQSSVSSLVNSQVGSIRKKSMEERHRLQRVASRQTGMVAPSAATGTASSGGSPSAAPASSNAPKRLVLVIDGAALAIALKNEPEKLLEVACECHSVVCCRVSPSQKAEVVDLVRRNKPGLTLAIGDGANDVNMIQRAHVGIGVSGQEGRQAAMSSDYSIARFRFLQRLLLVHGRWSYYRTSEMILTFFYKNFVFVFPLFWFQFLCGFSAQMIYHYSYQILYNLLFTSLPIIAVAALDQDLSQDCAMATPQAYAIGIRGDRFNAKLFWANILDGVYQGTVCFLFAFAVFAPTTAAFSGRDISLYGIGVVIGGGVVICAHLSLAIQVRNWTWIIAAVFILSAVTFFAFAIIAGSAIGANSFFTYNLSGTLEEELGQPSYWLTLLLMVTVAILPRFIVRFLLTTYWPLDSDIIREADVVATRAAAKERRRERRRQRA